VRIPILKQGPFLIASIQEAASDSDFQQLLHEIVTQVGEVRARGVVVDVTVLDVMDSFAARMLRDIAHAVRLRGAETVIVGIQPDAAFTMVRLGMTLEGVETALDLEEGMAWLASRADRRREP
jgi:rsbT antagonist protein RsbS